MTDAVVLDVSAALAWCFEDEATPASVTLLDRLIDGRIVVPGLWHIETANALLQAERRKRITTAEIADFVALLDTLAIETDPESERRALGSMLALARQHGLTAYDATYLETAQRRGLPLATRDRALRHAAEAVGIELIDC